MNDYKENSYELLYILSDPNHIARYAIYLYFTWHYSIFFVQIIDIFVQIGDPVIINLKGENKMANSTTNISIRIDSELKSQADALFGELGMNLSTAFNIFVRQSLREGRIPFEISLNQPSQETMAAMLEAERIAKDPSVKGYTDLDELFTDLRK